MLHGEPLHCKAEQLKSAQLSRALSSNLPTFIFLHEHVYPPNQGDRDPKGTRNPAVSFHSAQLRRTRPPEHRAASEFKLMRALFAALGKDPSFTSVKDMRNATFVHDVVSE